MKVAVVCIPFPLPIRRMHVIWRKGTVGTFGETLEKVTTLQNVGVLFLLQNT